MAWFLSCALEVVFIFVGVTNCLMFVLMGAMSARRRADDFGKRVFCLDDHLVHLLVLASYSHGIVNEVMI